MYEELKNIFNRHTGIGLDKVVLVMAMSNPPRGLRVRTPFGLCEVVNFQNGRVVIWVELSKVKKWLTKNKPTSSGTVDAQPLDDEEDPY